MEEVETIDAVARINGTDRTCDGQYGIVDCDIGGMATKFLIDSGASLNTISDVLWIEMEKLHVQGELNLTILERSKGARVFAYAASAPLEVLARFNADIKTTVLQRPTVNADFVVIKGGKRSLLGRTTAREMNLLRMGEELNNVGGANDTDNSEPFPIAPVAPVAFDIDPLVRPTRQHFSYIPDAFVKKTNERINKMIKEDIIERVTHTPEWLSGLNVVMKGKDDFRLTLNMKRANKAIKRPYYPMPTIEGIRQRIAGSKWFAKMDLSRAFYHLLLNEEARNMTCFICDEGIFRYKRLVFGVVSAPEIFQKFMNDVLKGITGVEVYIDDILIHTRTPQELQHTTDLVKERLAQYNLTVNEEKSEYERESLTFLGHRISGEGINIDEQKVKAVMSFRKPKDIAEVRSFLGLATFLGPFISYFSDLTEPLRMVVRNPKNFIWGRRQDEAFERIKTEIINCTTTLGAFNETDQTTLFTDASTTAVGAVLTQKKMNGREVIIAFASRALRPHERRYDQTSKEAMAIVWAMQHFHHYLLGRSFKLKSDSMGAIGMLTKEDPTRTKAILRRADGWRYKIEAFDCIIEHVKGPMNIADSASRLAINEAEPVEDQEEKELGPYEIGNVEMDFEHVQWSDEFLTLDELREASTSDIEINRVKEALETDKWQTDLLGYEAVKNELHISEDLLLRSDKIVIPTRCRLKAIKLAHKGHHGMDATKRQLRMDMWWSRMDRDVEKFVAKCEPCFRIIKQNNIVPMKRTIMPTEAWEKLATDHYGPMIQWNNNHVLVLIDYHSRYMIAEAVKSTDTETTLKVMEKHFEWLGYPRILRADNGPAFRKDFDNWCRERSIKPEHSIQYDPAQNGLAESSMKTVGKAMTTAYITDGNFLTALKNAVIAHNSTPHKITGMVPETAMFNRKLRRALPVLDTNESGVTQDEAKEEDARKKLAGKKAEDLRRGAKPSGIGVGDTVVCKNLSRRKLDPLFEAVRYEVVEKSDKKLSLVNDKGELRIRSLKDVKKQSAESLSEAGESQSRINDTTDTTQGTMTAAQDDQETIQQSSTTDSGLTDGLRRSSRITRAPRNLDDYLFMIGEDLVNEKL